MNYLNSSIKKYLDDLSAKLPAPGGGSASALTSSTGTALLLMVANFTVDKKGYEQFQDEIKKILTQLSSLVSHLSSLVDEDVAAYTILSGAYKLPRNTESEIKQRDEKIQEALKNAMSVPCRILEASVEALPIAERLSDIGNKNLLSDVICGVSLLRSGIESAKVNIDVNLKYIKDAGFNEKTKNKYEKIIKTAFSDIDGIIGKNE
ncbi:MAG: cyclodeaminase/cyclohydrolase family protein [Elusimicrobia bacterium]|nr:cyclodeaminase/cyclohydrolase family protein [Elusimicrobiota bacterium]